MGLFSFLNRFNNFSILATNISFIYITLKKNYGSQLDGRRLLLMTAIVNLQYYIQNKTYSINYLKDILLNNYLLITGADEDLFKITDIVIWIEYLIFLEQFKDISREETMNTVESQRKAIMESIKKVMLDSSPNTAKKKAYLEDINNIMTSPHLAEFRKEIGI